MSALVLVGAAVFYLVAYHTYGKFLAKKIFKLDESRITPAHAFNDGVDYVPTPRGVVFGHHYASIAGLGPIVGPALAVFWGWLPALIWVLVGPVIIGGLHDFGALVASLRHRGDSIGDLTGSIISRTARALFFFIILFELWVVIAIFALIMGVLFTRFPSSVIPIWGQIPVAMLLGFLLYNRVGNRTVNVALAVVLFYFLIFLGSKYVFQLPPRITILGHSFTAAQVWIVVLLVYVFFASTLPVWWLLQPRDYLNAIQLFIMMGLLAAGILVSHPPLVAPPVNPAASDAPPLVPFLFVIVACGAISGFHCLVSSGTSSKQLDKESDALFVGYGAMLLEGLLAVLALLAVAAGLGLGYGTQTGAGAWRALYTSWSAASGLGTKLTAFVAGSANFLTALRIPRDVAVTVVAVFIVSYASTTLDTATRLQRYVLTEIFRPVPPPLRKILTDKYFTTFLAVFSAFCLTLAQPGGKGALVLWPLFGTVNQLLAALALLVITFFLLRRGVSTWLVFTPTAFMIFITGWALLLNIENYFRTHNWLLFVVGSLVALLEVWLVIEGVKVAVSLFGKKRGSSSGAGG